MYEFIDTIENAAEEYLASEAVCYAGNILDSVVPGFRTLSVSGRELFGRKPETYSVGGNDGEYYRRSEYPARTITVRYQLIRPNNAAFRAAFNLLNSLLMPEQARLWFNDEQDKYFIATSASCGEVEEGRNAVTSEIEFYCADPKKYAFEPKEFSASADNDGILTATVVNGGTVPVPIDYEITMNGDNGYIGIVSANGAMQYGYVDESDGESLVRDEALLTMSEISAAACDTGGTIPFPPVAAGGTQGTMNYQKQGTPAEQAAAKNIKWMGLDSAGPNISGWHGAIKTILVPDDSQGDAGAVNFYSYTYHWFQLNNVKQQGAQCILFLDENDHIICGINIYKQHSGSTEAQVQHLVNGKVVWAKNFQANSSSKQNPYLVGYGHNDFRKVGSKITLYYMGKYYTYTVPELENTAVTKIKIGIFAMGSNPVMPRNYISSMCFWKLNVDYWEDRPNRYSEGDVLEIKGAEGAAYLNGMIRSGDEIIGTQYFKAEPGENLIQFVNSTWADPVTAKAKIREAWI